MFSWTECLLSGTSKICAYIFYCLTITPTIDEKVKVMNLPSLVPTRNKLRFSSRGKINDSALLACFTQTDAPADNGTSTPSKKP